MSELFERGDKKEMLKRLIRQLHEGVDVGVLKEQFKELLATVSPEEIARIEEELIGEGISREEIQRLCDIHFELFRGSLKEEPIAPPGHPINILMEEHKMLLRFVRILTDIASGKREIEKLKEVTEHFKEGEKHLLREENVLFPYLEKHGITQPPAIMWMEHDKVRGIEKSLYALEEEIGMEGSRERLKKIAKELDEALSSHIYKENHILYPIALRVVEEGEWGEIRKEFDRIGYCCFTPETATIAISLQTAPIKPKVEGRVELETGDFLPKELEVLLDTLPVEITFVDKDDIVRYFNQPKDRIFLRTKAVLGRKVQQCHPQKSLHLVNQILNEFKDGTRDVAEFWITREGRLIHIRYFAMRDEEGDYLGCVEMAQDITEIKKIEGEKRLL